MPTCNLSHCLVLVGSRHGFERDFVIELNVGSENSTLELTIHFLSKRNQPHSLPAVLKVNSILTHCVLSVFI